MRLDFLARPANAHNCRALMEQLLAVSSLFGDGTSEKSQFNQLASVNPICVRVAFIKILHADMQN